MIEGDNIANQYRELNIDIVKDVFIEKGYEPIFSIYKNAHQKLLCKNKEGYKVLLSYDKLKQDRKPQPFYIGNPYTIENIKHFININNLNDELLSHEFKGSNEYLKFKCKNEHIFKMKWKHYKQLHRCPYCKNNRGENKIASCLNNLSIEFEQQKKYDDLYGYKRQLSYDFYLPKYNMLIEYQGEQHERAIDYFGGEKRFKKQKEYDELKKKYAKDNNIKLLIIWYYDYNNIEYIINKIA